MKMKNNNNVVKFVPRGFNSQYSRKSTNNLRQSHDTNDTDTSFTHKTQTREPHINKTNKIWPARYEPNYLDCVELCALALDL